MVALGLGCNTLGAAGNRLSERGQVRLIHAAIDLGFTVFDTADAYGNGGSERVLGDALRGHRDRVAVATKVGYRFHDLSPARRRVRRILARTAGPIRSRLRSAVTGSGSGTQGGASYAVQCFDDAYLRSSVDGCRRRLGLHEIDVVMLHGPPTVDQAAVETLTDLRDRGWIGRIGVGTESDASASSWTTAEGIRVIELAVGVGVSTSIARRIGEAGIEAWARGVVRGGHAADPPQVADAVSRLAADAGVRPLDLDLSWIITRAAPEVVVVGASSEAHLVDLAACFFGDRVDHDVLDRLEAIRSV
jgi:aryl-alcohol dehydrogenase-like predicted oxidoreductase